MPKNAASNANSSSGYASADTQKANRLIDSLNQLLKQLDESARTVQAQVENLQEAVDTCAASALEEERQKLEKATQGIARMNKYKSN